MLIIFRQLFVFPQVSCTVIKIEFRFLPFCLASFRSNRIPKQERDRNITIMVGTNDLKHGGKYYKAVKAIPHEKYHYPLFSNDIALIQVDEEIEFNEKVQPIKYSDEFIDGGTKLRVTGWGRLGVSFFIISFIKVTECGELWKKCFLLHVDLARRHCASYDASFRCECNFQRWM